MIRPTARPVLNIIKGDAAGISDAPTRPMPATAQAPSTRITPSLSGVEQVGLVVFIAVAAQAAAGSTTSRSRALWLIPEQWGDPKD